MRRIMMIAVLALLAFPAAAMADTSRENAAKACKAERAKDPEAFKQKYGTNKNKSNALGKCISKKANSKGDDDQTAAEKTAAKECKAERAKDPEAFKQKYGTNKNKSNAYGKCVSQKAKANEQS